jgi:hypothetical protein
MTADEEPKKTPVPGLEELASQYAAKARQLDKVLSEITKDYCANKCTDLPVGCCFHDFANHEVEDGLAKALGKIYEDEARKKAFLERVAYSACDYHTRQGCVLETKPHVCLGFLCDELSDHLMLKYRWYRDIETNAISFVNSMRSIKSVFFSFSTSPGLFFYMDKAIESGNAIVEFENSRRLR